ncbi:MAG: acyl-CoA dehydrogenase family protein [Myxococcales bacterium]|nr:acyl-CoA dehydrogenase family protein [Myxococcales bacterium]
MQFALTEDQAMLAQTATAFVAEHSPLTRIRALRDAGDELCYSPALFGQMAELGWTAIPFAEADGGLAMGLTEAIIVTEALGRGLCPEPVLSSIMGGAQALALAGTPAQKNTWLAPAIAGEKTIALAYQERGGRFSTAAKSTRAERSGSGYKLAGEKTIVLGGAGADVYVVSAQLADGLGLFLVPAGASGLTVTPQKLVDGRNAAVLALSDVQVGEDALVGTPGGGLELLDDVLDRATVALCGEMLGGMQVAFDMTLAYLKERKQFDVHIGSFQGLQHRAAKMYIEVELARSATMAAARAIDEQNPQAKALVSNAKARCSDAYILIANEAVQMHGGIGMTDEHDIGFFIKRARAAEMTYGDAAYHRDRFARLSGY